MQPADHLSPLRERAGVRGVFGTATLASPSPGYHRRLRRGEVDTSTDSRYVRRRRWFPVVDAGGEAGDLGRGRSTGEKPAQPVWL